MSDLFQLRYSSNQTLSNSTFQNEAIVIWKYLEESVSITMVTVGKTCAVYGRLCIHRKQCSSEMGF